MIDRLISWWLIDWLVIDWFMYVLRMLYVCFMYALCMFLDCLRGDGVLMFLELSWDVYGIVVGLPMGHFLRAAFDMFAEWLWDTYVFFVLCMVCVWGCSWDVYGMFVEWWSDVFRMLTGFVDVCVTFLWMIFWYFLRCFRDEHGVCLGRVWYVFALFFIMSFVSKYFKTIPNTLYISFKNSHNKQMIFATAYLRYV